MPDRWEDLPIPEPSRLPLKIAVRVLPFFLSKTTAIDDEVVEFTRNGGWRKLDSLFPLLCGLAETDGVPIGYFEGWIQSLRQFTANVKVSDLPSFAVSN